MSETSLINRIHSDAPLVMAILNMTPDSFSDGGRFVSSSGVNIDKTLKTVQQMVQAGADIIDIGGESTRPGAEPVSLDMEVSRVLPIVEAVKREFDILLSVDTSQPEVIAGSAALGADLINDVRALSRKGAMVAAAKTGLPVCLMHMQGAPKDMQIKPRYENVVEEVNHFFDERISCAVACGIAKEKIILDPGFGFGKEDTHNLTLLKKLDRVGQGFPKLVGLSRKSIFGRLLGRNVDQRLAGSLTLGLASLQQGAAIIRVHDIAETVDMVRLFKMLKAI